MPQFALLMIAGPSDWGALPRAEQQRLMGLYGDWVSGLAARGVFKGGWPFSGESCVLRSGEGGIAVGPADEDRPAETGMFLVETPDLEAATEIARSCPALLHGETVIVHRVGLL